MKQGKQTCKILKEIRRQIAEANDIELITSECQYQGDCLGTCPKCESEVRYLEQQLERKRLAGKAVSLLGISAGVITMATSCGGGAQKKTATDAATTDTTVQTVTAEDSTCLMMVGEVEPDVKEDTVRMSINTSPPLEELKIIDGLIEVVPEEKDSTTAPQTPVYNPLPGIIEGEIISVVDTTTVDEPCELADVMPEFPGGVKELMKFIDEQRQYPPAAQENGVQGRVMMQFVVTKEGDIVRPKVVRGVDPSLDEEALRIIGLMPRWKPGELNGKKVDVRFTVPVTFKLQSSNS